MANQSDAFGKVIISTKNKEDLKNFMYLQLLSNKIPCVFNYSKINKEKVVNFLDTLITKNEQKYQVESHINIVDPEAFRTNIELFFKKILTKEYEDKNINDIRDRLRLIKLEATFNLHNYDVYSKSIDKIVYKVENFNGKDILTTIKE